MAIDALVGFLKSKRRLFVLTGAGCSTGSGIPDYRDVRGNWKHRQPMNFREFTGSFEARRRYWSRSFIGWRRIDSAEPNPAHHALAQLEQMGRVRCLVTQNVDGLHRKVGHRRVIDLHGRLDRVECLECRLLYRRDAFQAELERLNPDWRGVAAEIKPDGDALLVGGDESSFQVPDCPRCAGVLKPAVVFFGESVPRRRVRRAFTALDEADAVLVAGSSLMVFSGYRFARGASQRGIPIVLVNLGDTRADDEASCKVQAPCEEVLPKLVEELASPIKLGANSGESSNNHSRTVP